MEEAARAAGKPDIPYISQAPFTLKSAVLVACQFLSLAAPWSPHYRGMTGPAGLAGLVSREGLER
jgi:hypothetical protein